MASQITGFRVVKDGIKSGPLGIGGSGGDDDGLTILSYGNSTWDDFITAYNANKIVYCRASSASDPASGSQTRLAFMAYVNDAEDPTSVEFQYYRSVSSHSASQQGDQVFIYKLQKTGTAWTVTTRETSSKIATGDGLTGTYNDGTITLEADPSQAVTQGDTKPVSGDAVYTYIDTMITQALTGSY